MERSQLPGADIEQLKRDVFGSFLEIDRPEVVKHDALTAELSSFVECVREGRAPLVGGEQALQAMVLAGMILERVAMHQWDGHAEGAVGPAARVPERRKLAG